jgi:hypothetical protein
VARDDGTIVGSKELLITDSIVTSKLQSNPMDGPLSFRHVVESAARNPVEAGNMVLAWLQSWETNQGDAAARPSVDSVLLCPWLKMSGSGCNDDCSQCVDKRLELAVAPFRLLAVVNRPDLATQSSDCTSTGTEARLVFTAVVPDPAVTEPIDSAVPLPFTIIFEYAAPAHTTADLVEWEKSWHALGALDWGPQYDAALTALTERFVTPRGLLQRVRTNEIAFGKPLGLPWELREFAPITQNGAMRLVPARLATTPRMDENGSQALGTWVSDHNVAVLAGNAPIDPTMRGYAADMPAPDFQWTMPGVSESQRTAFSSSTCNGCHGGNRPSDALQFQHIAPQTTAPYYDSNGSPSSPNAPPPAATITGVSVSSYLRDSEGHGEVERRAAVLLSLLTQTCTTPAPADASAPPPYMGPTATADAGVTADAGPVISVKSLPRGWWGLH